MTTVLVCGGRGFGDWDHLVETLDTLHREHKFDILVHGAARGADAMAGTWGRNTGISVHEYPADWKLHGKAAGPIRNQLMLDSEPIDVVVCFPGGNGTADMKRRAIAKGIPVIDSETE